METIEQAKAELVPVPEERQGWKRRGMVLLSLAGVLVALILAASWAPDSRMTALRWVPSWAADWADRDPNIRTAVPFIPLAFLLSLGFGRCGIKRPLGWSVMLCGICLGLSELGQVFVPFRTADVRDLLWGGIGIVIGAGAAWGWRKAAVAARLSGPVARP